MEKAFVFDLKCNLPEQGETNGREAYGGNVGDKTAEHTAGGVDREGDGSDVGNDE